MGQTIEALCVRIDMLERDSAELFNRTNTAAVTLATVNEKLNSMLITLGELKAGMEKLQQQPAKRWELLVGAFISAVAAVLAGYISAKIFNL